MHVVRHEDISVEPDMAFALGHDRKEIKAPVEGSAEVEGVYE